jgi:hypothetical protein
MEVNDTVVFENSEISWPRPLRFWLLLTFVIPSIACSLFVLYHLLFDRTLRHALHNHTVIVLLILALNCQLIDISWYLDFLQRGIVWPKTPAHCLVWWLVDLGFYNTVAIILAWASIERHILVFYDRWIATKKKRFFVHYLPLITLLIYATIYYTIVIFFPPCQQTFLYTLPVCSAAPCHLFHPILGLWEIGVHGCLCTLIIAFSNLTLIIRVIIQKRQRTQIFQWKKYHKMIFQLISISVLYLLFNLPIMILLVARQCGLPADVGVEEQLVAFFLTYWVVLLLPMVSLCSLPELKARITRFVYRQERRQRRAIVFPMIRNVNIAAGMRQSCEIFHMT